MWNEKKKFTKKKIRKNIDKIKNSKFFFKKKKFLFFTIKNVPNNDVRIKFKFNKRLPEIAHRGIDKINK